MDTLPLHGRVFIWVLVDTCAHINTEFYIEEVYNHGGVFAHYTIRDLESSSYPYVG